MKNILKSTIILLTISAFLFSCSSDDDTPPNQNNFTLESDRNALIEIYNANTNNTLTWNITTTDVSTWDGVSVENNRISALSVGNKNATNFPTTAMQKLTALERFNANNNGIIAIDVSHNTNLKNLGLFHNQLTTIDVSNNILLEQLLLENNNLETLDVSMLSNLTDLKGGNNNFTNAVNIANGNNANMWRMQLSSNNLSCVQVDAGATNGFTGWLISAGANYVTNCN